MNKIKTLDDYLKSVLEKSPEFQALSKSFHEEIIVPMTTGTAEEKKKARELLYVMFCGLGASVNSENDWSSLLKDLFESEP